MSGIPPRFEITEAEIDLVVARFYARVRVHPVLAPIFAAHVEDWPAHEAKIARFWKGAILFQPGYEGSPMIAHRRAQNVEAAHFPQWLAAFDEVLNETLSPQAAAGWSALAHRIGQGLRMGVEDIGRPSGIVPTLR
ncbi:group III truncated hemoglobin [Sedimentimonas flavescens]|uniref:Group III truncated hemoglobin n=1 Tax=Sedimentimonas flavescens TaxID=2851012 RepID=A0ABT2ZVJ7_9RHOB|nr:group III truncated hemoglobin [Sedimentimonas flavescens]MBW0156908.1 group III truncated hemoglobin [Sedimentimonas flavescens]MCT2539400.1 group III truncated hemoglobin [Sedimentimonas flavescens]MCV2877320.1 group III truncated hemoglobin [Sedimentimonas flavescens]